MAQNNPLQRYFRQPKIFISLPSKGLYYPDGAFSGDYSNVPIFGMNGMDEIIYKTPDALFSGEATIKVIESCCPAIKDASKMPVLDVDTLLSAIRIATFGHELSVSHTCSNCGTEHNYDVDLREILDFYSKLTFDNKIQIDDLVITLRPISYADLTQLNVETFKLQKTLYQLENITDEKERQLQVDAVYKNLADLQTKMFIDSIESVQIPDGVVNQQEFILEWITNSDRELFNKIKTKLEENKAKWENPPQQTKCSECGHEETFNVTLDQSNFFVNA